MKFDGVEVKLPKEVKTKWIKALRSNKFKQKKNTLGNLKDGMCCLGVLCYINGVSEDGMINKAYPDELSEKDYVMLKEKGIPTELLVYGDGGNLPEKLAGFNDGYKTKSGKTLTKTFAQIATWIEKHL